MFVLVFEILNISIFVNNSWFNMKSNVNYVIVSYLSLFSGGESIYGEKFADENFKLKYEF